MLATVLCFFLSVLASEQNPTERHRAGAEHERAGRYAEALVEYLWCWDEGAKTPEYGDVRRKFLPANMARLGKRYPPALEAMRDRRDKAESRIKAGASSSDELADVCALNEKLEGPARNVRLFDELRTDGAAPEWSRPVFAMYLLEPLAAARRYPDILSIVGDPVRYAVDQIGAGSKSTEWYEDEETPARAKASIDSIKKNRVRKLIPVFEASVGSERPSDARKVAQALLEFAAIEDSYLALVEASSRAGDVDLARSFAEKGLATLPEASQRRLRAAFEKLPERK